MKSLFQQIITLFANDSLLVKDRNCHHLASRQGDEDKILPTARRVHMLFSFVLVMECMHKDGFEALVGLSMHVLLAYVTF